MSSTVTEPMFSLTPPPSEFDEVDQGSFLVCSPSLAGFTYPSPAPSHSGGLSLSDSAQTSQDGLPFRPRDSHQPTCNEFFFGEHSGASFLSISTLPEQDVGQFDTSNQSFDLFPQNPWMAFSSYPHQGPLAPYEASPRSSYPALEPAMPSSFPNVIPPTPQGVTAPVSFDINTLSRAIPPQRGLSTSSSFSLQSSAPSTFSISRSPSPAALQPGAGNKSGLKRTSLRSNSCSSSATNSLHAYGIPVTNSSSGTPQAAWRCAYPGCTSKATFTRGCDLRKHYNRHSKNLFCRVDGCPQSEAAALSRSQDRSLMGGFSSKKDRARHEAKHNPGIQCEWKGPNGEECGRIFSRMDNMKDHVRRIHKKQDQRLQIC